jgi:hypothetical protein
LVSVEKRGGKRICGRFRRRWKDNIKMAHQDILWGVDWIDPAQDRDEFTGFFEKGINPSVPVKCKEFLDSLKVC